MDWPKARAIMLLAFTLVNAVLVYAIWVPTGFFSGVAAVRRQELEHVRTTLSTRGLTLPTTVRLPTPPVQMRFLHVTYEPPNGTAEQAPKGSTDGSLPGLNPVFDKTGAISYSPKSLGDAAHEVKLENRDQVQQMAEEFLRAHGLLPQDAMFIGVTQRVSQGTVLVEWVPVFDHYPVYSGSVQAEVSSHGVETVRWYWVQPRQFTDAAPKAVRPATEALLRLAGRLGTRAKNPVVQEINLGYYAGRSLTEAPLGVLSGWDTVPVWRILLDSGEVFYINAFNGEWET
jgi:hypothetical protein